MVGHPCGLRRLKVEVERLLARVRQAPGIRKLSYQGDMERLSMREAARLCNMSATDFRRKFRATTGIGFHQFLIHLRLVQAMDLLARSCSITDSAFASGFGSLSALEYSFKKLIRSSPKTCRQCLRDGGPHCCE